MKRFLITFTLCVAFCSGALAQQTDSDAPASAADIQTYLETIHSHDMMKQMMEAMSKPMHQMVHDQYMKDKDKLPANFESQMNRIMDDTLAGMPMDEIMQAMVPVYQKHFTKRNVDDLIAFYSSPTGQKMLKEMPGIMAEAMQTMMPIMTKNIDMMKQRIDQQAAELMKESEKTPRQN
jgi:uncharacterized protein